MTGIPLCARFSLPTNRLGFCGTPDAGDLLRSAIAEGRESERAGQALRTFEALYPYLETIGAAAGLDPFDARVVEAYWVGGGLLDRDWRESFRVLLEKLATRGLPRSLAARLSSSLPAGAIPHHTFHVLFVGVGAVTGHVATTLANMERCRVSWGTVTEVREGALLVEGPGLQWDGHRFRIGTPRAFPVAHDQVLLRDVKKGDAVANHWEHAVDKLGSDRMVALERYTQRSLDAANEVARVLAARS
jgi:hypothetical protein